MLLLYELLEVLGNLRIGFPHVDVCLAAALWISGQAYTCHTTLLSSRLRQKGIMTMGLFLPFQPLGPAL
jgi:hypothetical protein